MNDEDISMTVSNFRKIAGIDNRQADELFLSLI